MLLLIIVQHSPSSAKFHTNLGLNVSCLPDRDLSTSSELWPSVGPFECSGGQILGIHALDAAYCFSNLLLA